MTLPSHCYHDPGAIAEEAESFEIGCVGCAKHQRIDNQWACERGIPGYPDLTNRQYIERDGVKVVNPAFCELWRARKKPTWLGG